MAKDKFINEGMEGYLSEKAHAVMSNLIELGCDKDLAFEITAQTLPEDAVYELPPKTERAPKWTTK